MSKQEYDNFAANKLRQVFYQKSWYVYGLEALKTLNIKNFCMLDIGCGNGEFSEMARETFNADVTCMDYANKHLARVKSLGFPTVKCDFDCPQNVENVQKQLKNSFDVIVAFEVIEHVFDVDTFLATIHGLLKENGVLLISTPNMAYFRYRLYSVFLGNIPVSEGHHVRFFNSRRLQQFLYVNGFDVTTDYSHKGPLDKVYDESGGDFVYYLDKLVGEKKQPLKKFCLRALFKLCSILIPSSSPLHHYTLLLVGKKANVAPLGINPLTRTTAYEKLSQEEKKKAIERLRPLRKELFFNEYPNLRKFIDQQASEKLPK